MHRFGRRGMRCGFGGRTLGGRPGLWNPPHTRTAQLRVSSVGRSRTRSRTAAEPDCEPVLADGSIEESMVPGVALCIPLQLSMTMCPVERESVVVTDW